MKVPSFEEQFEPAVMVQEELEMVAAEVCEGSEQQMVRLNVLPAAQNHSKMLTRSLVTVSVNAINVFFAVGA